MAGLTLSGHFTHSPPVLLTQEIGNELFCIVTYKSVFSEHNYVHVCVPPTSNWRLEDVEAGSHFRVWLIIFK